jgi:uncharacterized protein YndB with AHSA1/START domain
MPSVSLTRTIAAPQADVWAALADIDNARRWNPSWSKIEITSAQRHGLGTTFRAHIGDGQAFDFGITKWDPPQQIAFSPIRADSERYSITLESHTFRLRPAGDNETLVELIAHASAHGLRGHFVGLILWPGYQKHGLNTALDSLEAIFEPQSAGAASPGAD